VPKKIRWTAIMAIAAIPPPMNTHRNGRSCDVLVDAVMS
jgi:hypothetical protein